MSDRTILIVEDEIAIIEVLTYNLEQEGFHVITARDGQEGIRKTQASLPDLIILDLMLPVVDGLQVCRQIRSHTATQDIPILMLTAKSEELDEIVGFNMGADDYVTKPFKIKPLIHRIKALLRRPMGMKSSSDVIETRGIYIDRINHVVRLDGNELQLTPTEFRVLWTLAKQPGRPYRRNELMDVCRGEDANAMERTIDVHIRALRYKLEDRAGLIETVRGIGYRFQSL